MRDVKNIRRVKGLIDSILKKQPSDKEIEYNEYVIDLYGDMRRLKYSIETLGYTCATPIVPENINKEGIFHSIILPKSELEGIIKYLFGNNACLSEDKNHYCYIENTDDHMDAKQMLARYLDIPENFIALIQHSVPNLCQSYIPKTESSIVIILYRDPFDKE